MPTLELQIVGETPANLSLEPAERVFATLAARATELPAPPLPVPNGIINLALIDDERIRQLNREHAGHDYATDVLSFSYIEDGGQPIDGVLGEIAISLDTATRQAAAADTSLAEEVALLGLHGTLHILGYDHQTATEQGFLQQLQRELMAAAGYQYREFKWMD